MPDTAVGFLTNYGPSDLEAILERQLAEVASGTLTYTDDDDNELDGTVIDTADDDTAASSEMTSDEDDDESDDADDDRADGPEDSSDDDDESEAASVQDLEAENVDENQGDAADQKKKRRGGTLNRVLKENEELKSKLAEFETGLDERDTKILERFKSEQEEVARLTRESEALEIERQAVDSLVNKMTGTDTEVSQLLQAVENSDPMAAARLREIRENRTLLTSLMQFATNDTNRKMKAVYRKATDGIPGLDRTILDDGHLPTVIKHLDENGFARGKSEGEAGLTKLNEIIAAKDEEIEELKDKLTQKTGQAAGKPRRDVNVSGGKAPKPKTNDALDFDDYYAADGTLKPGAWDELMAQGKRNRMLGG